ncbi:hypothetical protein D3879_14705 [Pseudomonas cavernicola]|uniref:Terminase small subunit n=1 Tax=Pseudomonas cavernicola TaxID=2320866 RepID=A0A418XEU9_9PSED|nr:HGGxSTG domain-containing protein [Pseudomonas cavernicola]RJG10927.1 hypothetical protein D3879_14705 [Pseudomonas cavernicola]
MARCGAKTRSGQPCQSQAMPNGRCRMHGGKAGETHKGNQNARTHGIYSAFLSDDEKGAWDSLELGRVDDELRLTRIRLMRALARENEYGNTLELDSEKSEPIQIDGKDTGLTSVTTTSKVRDYAGLIDKLTARVESLERTRAELLKSNPPGQPPVARIEIEVVSGRQNPKAPDDGAAG